MLVPLLVVDLGLVVQLLVNRTLPEIPNDLILGPLVTNAALPWPYFGSYDRCLAVLVGAGWIISLLLALVLMGLR